MTASAWSSGNRGERQEQASEASKVAASGNLFEAFEQVAGEAMSNPLLELGDGTFRTYGQMLDRTAQLSNLLCDQGVRPGDRVAVQVEKSAEALFLYLACLRAGAVFLPLNTAYTAHELDHFFQDAAPSLIVCDPAKKDVLAGRPSVGEARVLELDDNGRGELAGLADNASLTFATVPRDAEDLASLIYTSGTTGRAKGAMLSHRAILSNARTLVRYWGFSAADVLLHMLPIYHVHGLFVACNTLMLAGGRMIFLPKFEAALACQLLPRATSMMGVPTFYTRLLNCTEFNGEAVRPVRLFISGSAPLLPETFVAFERVTGQHILERYGMTECGMNTSNPLDSVRKAGTVGLPLPEIEVRVCDEAGAPVEAGEPGIVEVRG
ncbi:MAG: AMP-binding protein, partial [Pseudomonadota bacterium]